LDNSVATNPVSLDVINLPGYYKNVTIGKTLVAAEQTAFTYMGVSLTPWSPVNLSATKSISTDAITIKWIRRTRFGGQWVDRSEVPLNEATEIYEVDILNGAAVVRTLTSSSPSVIYSSANQIEDFGSVQSSVSVHIYQISAVVGRGFPGSGVISPVLIS
jgi:hypothetical protein